MQQQCRLKREPVYVCIKYGTNNQYYYCHSLVSKLLGSRLDRNTYNRYSPENEFYNSLQAFSRHEAWINEIQHHGLFKAVQLPELHYQAIFNGIVIHSGDPFLRMRTLLHSPTHIAKINPFCTKHVYSKSYVRLSSIIL